MKPRRRVTKTLGAASRCLDSGIDSLVVTQHLAPEFQGDSLAETITAINAAMRDINLSKRSKPDGYRDARAHWASKDNTVTVTLEKSGCWTKFRFQSKGAVVRQQSSLGHYSGFREALGKHGISTVGEQVLEVDFAIDFPEEAFVKVIRATKHNQYGNVRTKPVYGHKAGEGIKSVTCGSNKRSHVYIYKKEVPKSKDAAQRNSNLAHKLISRFEFRARSKMLDRCGIHTVEQLCDSRRLRKLKGALNKLFRLTILPRTQARHHTELVTSSFWKRITAHLSALLDGIAQEHVPESPPPRKYSVDDINNHVRSIEGSFIGLVGTCINEAQSVPLPVSLGRITDAARLMLLTAAFIETALPRGSNKFLWDQRLFSYHDPVPMTASHYEQLLQRRKDMECHKIQKLSAMLTSGNRHKVLRLRYLESLRTKLQCQRLNDIVYIRPHT